MALLLIICAIAFSANSQTKIQLFPENVTDLFGLNDFGYPAQHLLDEQKLAGDPLNDPANAGQCNTSWLPIYSPDWYPQGNPSFPGPKAAIDLGNIYQISNLCVFVSWSTWNMTWAISEKNPYDPNPNIQFTSEVHGGTWGNKWNCINFTASQNTNGQFITLSLFNPPETALMEIVVYGIMKNEEKQASNSNYKYLGDPTPLGMILGTNGFGWTPINNLTDSVGTRIIQITYFFYCGSRMHLQKVDQI